MGHKAHPIGLRLGIHRKWKSNWFINFKNYGNLLHVNLNIDRFFRGFLYFYCIKTLLIKTQVIKLPSNQLFIFVFYYRFRKKKKKSIFRWKFKKWKNNLEKIFIKKEILKKKLLKTEKLKTFFLQKNSKLFNIILHKNLNKTEKKLKLNTHFCLKIFIVNFIKFIKNLKKIKLILNVNLKKKLNYIKLFFKRKIIKLKNILKIFLITRFLKINKILFKKYFLFFIIDQIKLSYKKIWNHILKKFSIFTEIEQLKLFCLFNRYIRKYKKIKYFLNKYFLKNNVLNSLKKSKKLKKRVYKTQKNIIITKRNYYINSKKIKLFFSKITNLKIKLIFINTLSFTKFFYQVVDRLRKKKKKSLEKFNVFGLQRMMVNKYKYTAIFIKDFIHLAFIAVLLKEMQCIVLFIGQQFKRLPKNRKQFKLLTFIQQSLKILCQQRNEFLGFKLQINGRLNRRNRTHTWNFQRGVLALQSYKTRVEYAYSEGFTRSGLIGIKLWLFYKQYFTQLLKKKILQYFFYSSYKKILNNCLTITYKPVFKWKKIIKKKANVKTKSKKISKK